MTFESALKKVVKLGAKFAVRKNGEIRLKSSYDICPLAACANYLLDLKFTSSDYLEAAEALDIDYDTAEELVNATDDDENGYIRRRILKILKLKETING